MSNRMEEIMTAKSWERIKKRNLAFDLSNENGLLRRVAKIRDARAQAMALELVIEGDTKWRELSNRELASKTGFDRRTVAKGLKRLEDEGLIPTRAAIKAERDAVMEAWRDTVQCKKEAKRRLEEGNSLPGRGTSGR